MLYFGPSIQPCCHGQLTLALLAASTPSLVLIIQQSAPRARSYTTDPVQSKHSPSPHPTHTSQALVIQLQEKEDELEEIAKANFGRFLAEGGSSRDDADEERISQLGVLPGVGQGSDKASGSDKQQGSDEASGSDKQPGSNGERAAYQEPSSDDELGEEDWKFGDAWQLTDEARGGDKQLV